MLGCPECGSLVSHHHEPSCSWKARHAPEWWYPTAFSLWGDEERAAVARVLASNRLTMGPEVASFEVEFAAYHDRRHAVMINSGSSANLVATAALLHKADRPLRAGDKAIVPAVAWSTTYAPLVQHGLDLVLCDVDGSWNADPEMEFSDLMRVHEARLVVGCSILGNPADLAKWRTVAGVLGAYMIEDNCESLGAVTPGVSTPPGTRLCGTFGDLATSSLFWSHQLSAVEGGVVLTDDDELAGLCRMLRAHGWTRDVKRPKSFEDEYDFQLMGYNVRPLEMHAAVAREQLRRLPGFIQERCANMGLFRRLTSDLVEAGKLVHPDVVHGAPSPFGLHFEVASPEARARLVPALRMRGIDCRLPTGGSFRRHAYGLPWASQVTPNADRIHDRGMFLGNAPFDIGDKISAAVDVMRNVL